MMHEVTILVSCMIGWPVVMISSVAMDSTLHGTLVFEKSCVKGLAHGSPKNIYFDNADSHSLDKKCANGLGIGIGSHVYMPYTKVELNGSHVLMSGIFPHITKELLNHCCPQSKATYGHIYDSITTLRDGIKEGSKIDISFPVYGPDGLKSTLFKDFPFIPVVTAPKIVLVVDDKLYQERNTRMQVVMNTIFNAWPVLAFLAVSAILAGLIIWLLDFKSNPHEFPSTFLAGSWEGIWWAVVTMTTVGYGDRSPKSPWARAFCILWILLGVVLISLFTGLVTSALYASSTVVYNIPGSQIGAVYGSIEFQVGVGMNAEMKSYKSHNDMLDAMTSQTGDHIQAGMLDNFVLSASAHIFKKENLRMDREIDHPVTYGMVIAQNSSNVEKCFRKYIRWHPERIFDIIAANLVPIKNPTDNIRLEVAAAEKVFYEEALFKWIVYTEVGVCLAAFCCGTLWELIVRNKRGPSCPLNCLRKKDSPRQSFSLVKSCDPNKQLPDELQSMVTEYSDFHSMWVEKVMSMCNHDSRHNLHQ